MCQETLHIEGAFRRQHQIDGPAELGGQDRKRLGLAVSAGQATKLLLALRIAAKEEDCGLGESPLEVNVPSLVHSNSTWLFVQLAPGSRKGQSSSDERHSALHECPEGRWVPNQSLRMPGMFHEAIA